MKVTLRLLSSAVVMLSLAAALFAQSSSPPTTTKNRPAAASAKDVQELKDAVSAQQQQIKQQNELIERLQTQLEQLVSANQQNSSASQKTQSDVSQAQNTAAQAQQSAADAQRTAEQASKDASELKTALVGVNTSEQSTHRELAALEGLVGRFRLSGDVRLRGEDFFQQGVPDLNQVRIRVRLGVDGQLNEDFVGGLALATGALGNPTTTNETLTNNFDRKTIGLDRGYVTYNPVAHSWLSLTGGKFAYTWIRTSSTFDPDINPEGFVEKLSFDFSGPIKNFSAQAVELLIDKPNGKPGIPSQTAYTTGGQVSARIEAGPWTATPSILSMKWNRPDEILQSSAFAVGATTTGFLPTGSTTPVTGIPVPGEGQGCAKGGFKGASFPSFAPCVFAPNGMTNSTYVDSKGIPHFYSGFNYVDFILNNQIQDGITRLPINLLVEFLDNPDAEAHPLSTTGKVLTNLGSQNKEYGFDFSLGQTKNRNDIQVGYSWYREEQDAAIASFVESDQRAPTNILQNRFYALWKLRSNTLASFTWWRGRALNTFLENNVALFNNYNTSVPTITKAGQIEPYLNRLQFDLIYNF